MARNKDLRGKVKRINVAGPNSFNFEIQPLDEQNNPIPDKENENILVQNISRYSAAAYKNTVVVITFDRDMIMLGIRVDEEEPRRIDNSQPEL